MPFKPDDVLEDRQAFRDTTTAAIAPAPQKPQEETPTNPIDLDKMYLDLIKVSNEIRANFKAFADQESTRKEFVLDRTFIEGLISE